MIDTKRLATDAAYWREVAPFGASHFDKDRYLWIMQIGYNAWYWDGDWRQYKSQERFEWHMSNAITRPQSPEAEWVDGLPPVGAMCEVVDDGCLVYGQGESGECIAHVENAAVIRMSYGLGCFEARFLKPIRTPEQRQREELVSIINDCENVADIPDAILSHFTLEPKP